MPIRSRPLRKSHGLMDEVPLLDAAMRMPLFETREDEISCCVRAMAGDKRAIDEVCKRNTRLAASVAIKAQYAWRLPRYAFADLMQEGLLGIVRALQDFKPARGFRFNTYATWWIKAYVNRAAKKAKSLVSRVGDPLDDCSLDAPMTSQFDGEEGETHMDGLRSISVPQDLAAAHSEMADSLSVRLAKLEKRLTMLSTKAPRLPIDIVEMRLMQDERDQQTLDEIGKIHSCSRERVRQVEKEVKRILGNVLEDFREAA